MNPRNSRYFTYIRPVFKNKIVKTYSSLVFSLITITIFSLYAIKPTVSTILSLQRGMDEQKQVLQKLQNKENSLSAGKSNYEAIDPGIKLRLNNSIPSEPSLPGLIVSISNVVTQSEATLSGLQFQPTDLENPNPKFNKKATLKEIEFTLNTQGQYSNLTKLLDQLKQMDRLVSVTSVNFTKTTEGTIVMSINGKAFYLKN